MVVGGMVDVVVVEVVLVEVVLVEVVLVDEVLDDVVLSVDGTVAAVSEAPATVAVAPPPVVESGDCEPPVQPASTETPNPQAPRTTASKRINRRPPSRRAGIPSNCDAEFFIADYRDLGAVASASCCRRTIRPIPASARSSMAFNWSRPKATPSAVP